MVAQVPPRKYRIERYLAEGGMGAIYVGKKIGAGGFEKEVVLKQLLPEFTSRPEFRDLFFREAKISGTLDHQNIVRTFDLVKSDERLFIVMEYVRGADLRTIAWRARRKRPLSPQAVLHVALEILAGLAYAHSRRSSSGEPLGIIHRDLSPSNILCSGEGEVKLSDFGIAKAVTYSSVFYRVRGKVGYMSPEMARNQPIDARSDLFSMGVSIYETFIGERVYAGDLNTPPDQIYAQVIPPLAKKCPHLPAQLQGVLDKALALNRDDRFQDAEAFADALRAVARKHGLLYSAPQLAAELRELLGPNPEAWISETSQPPARAAQLPTNVAGQEASSVSAEDGAGDGVVDVPVDPNEPSTPIAVPAITRTASLAALAAHRGGDEPAPSLPEAPGMVRPPSAPPAPSTRSSASVPALRSSPASPSARSSASVPVLRVPPSAAADAVAPSSTSRGGVAALRRRPRGRAALLVGVLIAAGVAAALFFGLGGP
jgi:serine/threonine-protein kinase